MASRWPTRWRQQLMEDMGIEPTQFVLDVLSAWRKSTPLEPWTNNPIGLDAKVAGKPHVPMTRYAIFPTMSSFRTEMVRLQATSAGQRLTLALTHGDNHGKVWRAIQALNTPGRATETDYPSAVLDMAGEKYAEKVRAARKEDRKTTGIINPQSTAKDAARLQNQALHHAATHIVDANRAIEHIVRRFT